MIRKYVYVNNAIFLEKVTFVILCNSKRLDIYNSSLDNYLLGNEKPRKCSDNLVPKTYCFRAHNF